MIVLPTEALATWAFTGVSAGIIGETSPTGNGNANNRNTAFLSFPGQSP